MVRCRGHRVAQSGGAEWRRRRSAARRGDGLSHIVGLALLVGVELLLARLEGCAEFGHLILRVLMEFLKIGFRPLKEFPGLLAIDVLLVLVHFEVDEQGEGVHILELHCPEHGAAPVVGPVLRVLPVCNQLAHERVRGSRRCRLPERSERVRVLEDLLGAGERHQHQREEGAHGSSCKVLQRRGRKVREALRCTRVVCG